MSNRAINAARELRKSEKLSHPSQKAVLLVLADRCNDDGRKLFPSNQRIADCCFISKSQAIRILRHLIQIGYLEVIGNKRGGRPGQTKRYRLNIEAIEVDVEAQKALRCDYDDESDDEDCSDDPTYTGGTDDIRINIDNETGSTDDTRTDSAHDTRLNGRVAPVTPVGVAPMLPVEGGRVAPMLQTGSTHDTRSISYPSELQLQESLSVESRESEKKERSKKTRKSSEGPEPTLMTITVLPDEWRDHIQSERPDLKPDDIFEEFVAYWTEGKGRTTKRSNWLLSWRKWIRNEPLARGRSVAPLRPPTFAEQRAQSYYEQTQGSRNGRVIDMEPASVRPVRSDLWSAKDVLDVGDVGHGSGSRNVGTAVATVQGRDDRPRDSGLDRFGHFLAADVE